MNPWEVDNLQEFLFYHCPECDFINKEESEFYSHAVESHVQARAIFYKDSNLNIKIEDIDVPLEEMDDSQQITLGPWFM